MGNVVCHAGTGPNDIWSYCPSLGAAILFTALFGITTCTHIVQAIVYRKPFAAVLIMGGLWETGGYVARIASIENQRSSGIYTAQLLLILLAPLWINAYIYMLLGRMIHFFLPKNEDRVFKVRARAITRMFVAFDITAFLIQAVGGTMTGPGASASVQKTGLNIYTAGVGVQLFFLAVFVSLAIGFQRKVKQLKKEEHHSSTMNSGFYLADIETQYQHAHTHVPSPSQTRSSSPTPENNATTLPNLDLATPLLRVLYITLALIIIRNIYRLVEFGMGANSPTVTHEWFAYVFDGVPMFFALVVLNVFYPGKYLQGERSDFSQEDKERKQKKKEDRKERKEMKRMAKGGRSGKGGAAYEALKP
ncbi:uncharacterized protein Z520_04623 [Fonsecaea multimorphosa CBS 102226]|uniref:RTA1 domain protein n=1 Tax=Fonsecaea multimorphosa CBS 102226 TaxID=1442371 RepID=A0A0D2HDM2_9EURO|nr:uncharacterized protein Z520_04623 [Fonsecaea multimorphosa CBS 102226]KIX99985.1 hypothetical protein Z520_04623 [Fonsecaea multimorphosa CBS 102226]OAL26199.1 hypothetical protein AYO22_04377 [Fonsecaea multimorphosa]